MKILLGLGTIVLPWTFWPEKFGKAMDTWLSRPPVELIRPPAKTIKKPVTEESLERTAMDDIIVLAGPEEQGRRASSPGEGRAADYLSSQLSMLGLQPLGDNGTFTQTFTIPPVIEEVVNGRLTFRPGERGDLRSPAVNIIGGLEGQNPNEKILISAHYDHLGIFEGKLYPGANDNASGVGCLLDVMRRLVQEGISPKRTIVIAFWSAEEMGFIGSNYFVQYPTFPLAELRAVLNVDTVGNGMIGDFALWADGENIAVRAIQEAAAQAKASALISPTGGHNSDQISFAQAKIPAVTLMARDWLYKNHTPEDGIGFVKPEQIRLASEIIYRALQQLAAI